MITENPKRILLADDSMLIRAKLGHMIEEAGHHVTLAVDGSAVIETLKSGAFDFDLIILDINMPHINGFAVLEWMKLNGYLEGIPVLCLTDFYDINKISWKVNELGAEGVLIKGLTPAQTINAINKILFRETKKTRQEERIFTSIDADFTVSHKNYTGRILNISKGGIFLKTDARLHRGYTVSLSFTIPGLDATLMRPKGSVKWITPPTKQNDFFTGAGIQFKVITESNKDAIREFLSAHFPKKQDSAKRA